MLPISNYWTLVLGIGNIGNNGDIRRGGPRGE